MEMYGCKLMFVSLSIRNKIFGCFLTLFVASTRAFYFTSNMFTKPNQRCRRLQNLIAIHLTLKTKTQCVCVQPIDIFNAQPIDTNNIDSFSYCCLLFFQLATQMLNPLPE